MAPTQRSLRLAFLGCGHIGSTLLRAVLPSVAKSQSPISKVIVALNDNEAHTRLQKSFNGRLDPADLFCGNNAEAVRNADAVLFAFPPEKVHEVLAEAEMRNALRHKIIISILARTPRAEIARIINGQDTAAPSTADGLRIVRAMPTMGAEVYESATLIGKTSNPLEKEAVELAEWIFNSVGRVFHVTHDYFDAATGMSAFSNALTTTAVQVISQRAVAEGIPKDHAIAIASQCIRGMASLMLTGTSPEQLQWSLSAPGSITGQAILRLHRLSLPQSIGRRSTKHSLQYIPLSQVQFLNYNVIPSFISMLLPKDCTWHLAYLILEAPS